LHGGFEIGDRPGDPHRRGHIGHRQVEPCDDSLHEFAVIVELRRQTGEFMKHLRRRPTRRGDLGGQGVGGRIQNCSNLGIGRRQTGCTAHRRVQAGG
jgi:hypothetical protein